MIEGGSLLLQLGTYFFGFGAGEGGLFPLPPPEGFPVVLGLLTGFVDFAIFKI